MDDNDPDPQSLTETEIQILVRSQWLCTTYPGICVYTLLIAGWMQKELAWGGASPGEVVFDD